MDMSIPKPGLLCRILLSTALIVPLAPATAQESNPPAKDPAGGREQQSTAETTEPAEESQPEPAASETSPFDYEASEQISEDRSVSFPVDI